MGQLRAEPGAPNVVPGRVVASLELRDLDAAKVRRLYDRIVAESRAIAEAGGTTIAFATLTDHGPALTDPRMQRVVADSARALGLSSKVMPSGAGHDAQYMARKVPAAMLFVPSIGGISHHWAEDTAPEDLAMGLRVLAEGARRFLDREP